MVSNSVMPWIMTVYRPQSDTLAAISRARPTERPFATISLPPVRVLVISHKSRFLMHGLQHGAKSLRTGPCSKLSAALFHLILCIPPICCNPISCSSSLRARVLTLKSGPRGIGGLWLPKSDATATRKAAFIYLVQARARTHTFVAVT